MTLAELRTKADAKLATFWNMLVEKQTAYHAKHGKYFQLLVSPETSVVDGVDSTFTVRKAGDEKYTIDVDFPWTDKVPFQIQVSEWVGPQGVGYRASVLVELPDGRRFERSRDSNNVDSGWSLVTTD